MAHLKKSSFEALSSMLNDSTDFPTIVDKIEKLDTQARKIIKMMPVIGGILYGAKSEGYNILDAYCTMMTDIMDHIMREFYALPKTLMMIAINKESCPIIKSTYNKLMNSPIISHSTSISVELKEYEKYLVDVIISKVQKPISGEHDEKSYRAKELSGPEKAKIASQFMKNLHRSTFILFNFSLAVGPTYYPKGYTFESISETIDRVCKLTLPDDEEMFERNYTICVKLYLNAFELYNIVYIPILMFRQLRKQLVKG